MKKLICLVALLTLTASVWAATPLIIDIAQNAVTVSGELKGKIADNLVSVSNKVNILTYSYNSTSGTVSEVVGNLNSVSNAASGVVNQSSALASVSNNLNTLSSSYSSTSNAFLTISSSNESRRSSAAIDVIALQNNISWYRIASGDYSWFSISADNKIYASKMGANGIVSFGYDCYPKTDSTGGSNMLVVVNSTLGNYTQGITFNHLFGNTWYGCSSNNLFISTNDLVTITSLGTAGSYQKQFNAAVTDDRGVTTWGFHTAWAGSAHTNKIMMTSNNASSILTRTFVSAQIGGDGGDIDYGQSVADSLIYLGGNKLMIRAKTNSAYWSDDYFATYKTNTIAAALSSAFCSGVKNEAYWIGYTSTITSNTVIYKTTDSGNTWINIATLNNIKYSSAPFYLGGNTIAFIGYMNPNVYFCVSNDGGYTWRYEYVHEINSSLNDTNIRNWIKGQNILVNKYGLYIGAYWGSGVSQNGIYVKPYRSAGGVTVGVDNFLWIRPSAGVMYASRVGQMYIDTSGQLYITTNGTTWTPK